MYQVSLKILDRLKVELILVSYWERNGEGVLAYSVLLNIDYNVMCRWKGSENRGRESDKESILKSMVVRGGGFHSPLHLFSILMLFLSSMMSVRCGEIW